MSWFERKAHVARIHNHLCQCPYKMIHLMLQYTLSSYQLCEEKKKREETVMGNDNSVNSLSHLINYENVNIPFYVLTCISIVLFDLVLVKMHFVDFLSNVLYHFMI